MRAETVLVPFGICASAVALSTEQHSSRRYFLQKWAVATPAFAIGSSFNVDLHDSAGNGCSCLLCRRNNVLFGVAPVNAYERRNVGGDNPSAATYALNEQALKTNNRLESEGYKLQTEAEQTAEAKSFLSSYSYDADIPSSKSKAKAKKGLDSKR
ncbi:hypothetical protein FisN_1Lh338 [Fistulifera solaris]|uniref:Uncharacterized protein n=1 Tax=Fistulifera solaris TaxID=1519565 RepID=A0A1Z5K445_FISSO|nr:hypothetical protein FisN_1Lh338 [Fistulifera solaris]|eukprot:GAX20995.1 hypothetical protein FisN_1Lh338 [Fistulifera solaris]